MVTCQTVLAESAESGFWGWETLTSLMAREMVSMGQTGLPGSEHQQIGLASETGGFRSKSGALETALNFSWPQLAEMRRHSMGMVHSTPTPSAPSALRTSVCPVSC